MCLEFTIIKQLYICFNLYRPLYRNNLNAFFEEITVSLNKAIIRYENVISPGRFCHRHAYSFRNQLNDGGLMKNDELTKDLVLSKKLTSFQKLTGLCDYHKLIVNNHALKLFKFHMGYGILHRTTKNIWGFLVFSTNQFFG